MQDAVSQPSGFTCPISIMNQCLESAYMVCVEEVNVAIAEHRQSTYEHMSTCRHPCVRVNGTYILKVGGGKRRRNPSHAHKELLVSVVAERGVEHMQ